MAGIPKVSSSYGTVPGKTHEEAMVCQYADMISSKGCSWFGGEPFSFTLPVLLVQLVLIFLLSRLTFFFLRPLKQSLISAQVIASMIITHSFLMRNEAFSKRLFPPGGRIVFETIASLGFMLHLFILGVQVDASLVMKAGRNAVLIGFTGFALPYALSWLAIVTLANLVIPDDRIKKTLPFIAALNSMSSSPVITSLLADLKILSSELGRLAASTALVCDICSYFIFMMVATVGVAIRDVELKPLRNILWTGAFIVLVLFVFRPIIVKIGKRIPKGQPMKESQFFAILLVVLVSGFCAQTLGQSSGLASFVLGVSVPGGPPLGSSLVNKLDTIATGILLPAKVAMSGLSVDLFSIGRGSSGVVLEFFIILGYVGKFVGTFIPAIYNRVPFKDAVSLALIICCKGLIEIAIYVIYVDNGLINQEEFALLLVTMLIVTGVARPLIWYLYDPSRRYFAYKRNSILHSNPDSELRILVCIHKEDNVPTIVNLLEASKPTRNRPIHVFVLNLMELTGSAASILVPTFRNGNITSTPGRAEVIFKAFNYFEKQNQGFATVQHFTAITPYVSMHDDICTVALDKKATIIIVPFHKQWAIDGSVGATFPAIRAVNQNVIQKAPCSVGILVDRGQMGGSQSVLTGRSLFSVATLFIGGADDREALAYSSLLAEHPHISLTLIWLKMRSQEKYENKMEKTLDSELINQFRANSMGEDRIVYKEEMVKDAVGTTRVLRTMEDGCDLFIVGRYHEPHSPLIYGLTHWSECPELGVLGDMLATSDFRFSVLVVQQQPPEPGFQDATAKKPSTCSGIVDTKMYQAPFDTKDGLDFSRSV